MNRKATMKTAPVVVLLSLVWLAVMGCGPRLSSDELGTIVRQPPKVPGADGPYLMPQLEPPPATEPDDDKGRSASAEEPESPDAKPAEARVSPEPASALP